MEAILILLSFLAVAAVGFHLVNGLDVLLEKAESEREGALIGNITWETGSTASCGETGRT